MAAPVELARSVAGFDLPAVAHMQRLVRTWGLLADLSLGDVLLLAPVVDDPDGRFVVLANVRASTAATLYAHDRPTPEGIPGGVPVHWSGARCAGAGLVAGPSPTPLTPPVFYGVDAATPGGPSEYLAISRSASAHQRLTTSSACE